MKNKCILEPYSWKSVTTTALFVPHICFHRAWHTWPELPRRPTHTSSDTSSGCLVHVVNLRAWVPSLPRLRPRSFVDHVDILSLDRPDMHGFHAAADRSRNSSLNKVRNQTTPGENKRNATPSSLLTVHVSLPQTSQRGASLFEGYKGTVALSVVTKI